MRFDTRYSGDRTMESTVPGGSLGRVGIGPALTPDMFRRRGSSDENAPVSAFGSAGVKGKGASPDYEDVDVPVYNAGMGLVPGQTSSELQKLRVYKDGRVLNLSGNRYNPSQFFGGLGGEGKVTQQWAATPTKDYVGDARAASDDAQTKGAAEADARRALDLQRMYAEAAKRG